MKGDLLEALLRIKALIDAYIDEQQRIDKAFESIKRLKTDIKHNYSNVAYVKRNMGEIACFFSNQQYQHISQDFHFERVPEALWKLWYSDENHAIAICNMDIFYSRSLHGQISEEEFISQISELIDALVREFELLIKANMWKGEKR